MKKVQIGKRYRTIAEVHAMHNAPIGTEFTCDKIYSADGFPGSKELQWGTGYDDDDMKWLCVPEESKSIDVWKFIEEVPEK